MRPSFTERAKAKLLFFALYAASIGIILFLFVTFFYTGASASTGADVAAGNSLRTTADALLHQKLESLQQAYTSEKQTVDTELLERKRAEFINTIDSIRKSTAALGDAGQQTEIEGLLQAFARHEAAQYQVAKNQKPVITDSTSAVAALQEELNELKTILVQKEEQLLATEKQSRTALAEKEQQITSLRKNGSFQPLQIGKNDADAAAWKAKYNTLKASHDKTAGQITDLRASYKEVVDDNRRLIAQLQQIRAAKN